MSPNLVRALRFIRKRMTVPAKLNGQLRIAEEEGYAVSSFGSWELTANGKRIVERFDELPQSRGLQ